MQVREMDERVTYMQQLQEEDGPIVLINEFNVPPADVESFLAVWVDDATFMKQQLGFISTQLHRGTARSTTFVNVAAGSRRGRSARPFAPPSSRHAPRAIPRRPSPPRTCSRKSPSRGFALPDAPTRNGRGRDSRRDESGA
jgi:hypothetical protein